MSITPLQHQEMVSRLEKNRGREAKLEAEVSKIGESRETDLHKRIIWWCDNQFPFVPYIHARTDKRSTIGVGCADFCLLYKSKCVLIECKSRIGKLSTEQTAWIRRVDEQGFTVHIIRDFRSFLKLMGSIS